MTTINLVSDALKEIVNHDPKLIRFFEDTTIEALSYKPKYNCGLSFDDYFESKTGSDSLSDIEKKIEYGLYRMRLDMLHEKRRMNDEARD